MNDIFFLIVEIKPIIYKEPEISEAAISEDDIAEALKDLGAKGSERVLRECKEVVDGNKAISENYILSHEEAVLVTSYTYEDKINETSPYKIINKKLWEGSIQDQFTKKKSYLCLLLRALRKLPRTKPQTLYRGIKDDVHEYKVGDKIEWKGFSSTSTSLMVTQNFLKNSKTKKVEGKLFEIRNGWGYDIRDFSCVPKEEGNITDA